MRTISVVVVTAHSSIRAGVSALLGTEADLLVVGETESLDETLALCATAVPDVILLDSKVFDREELAEALQAKGLDSVAIVLLDTSSGALSWSTTRWQRFNLVRQSSLTALVGAIRAATRPTPYSRGA